jgi:hypothetical protein
MERNPQYFRSARPYLDRLVLRVLPDTTSQIAALENREVDVIGEVESDVFTRVAGIKGVKAVQVTAPSTTSCSTPIGPPSTTRVSARRCGWRGRNRPSGPRTRRGPGGRFELVALVEAVGIEPTSGNPWQQASTSIAGFLLLSLPGSPTGRISGQPAPEDLAPHPGAGLGASHQSMTP